MDETALSLSLSSHFVKWEQPSTSSIHWGIGESPNGTWGLFFTQDTVSQSVTSFREPQTTPTPNLTIPRNPAGSDLSRLLWATATAQRRLQAARARCGVQSASVSPTWPARGHERLPGCSTLGGWDVEDSSLCRLLAWWVTSVRLASPFSLAPMGGAGTHETLGKAAE